MKNDDFVKEYEVLKTLQAPFRNVWQAIGEFIFTRKQDYTSQSMPGKVSTEDLFDMTGPYSHQLLASTMVGMMWPNSQRTIRLVRPDYIPESDAVHRYYIEITKRQTRLMGTSKGRLKLSLHEAFLDLTAPGTAGVGVVKGTKEAPLRYKPYGVRDFVIGENGHEEVDRFYGKLTYNAHRMIDLFGYENVSKGVREAYDKRDWGREFEVLWAVRPRLEHERTRFGINSLPFISAFIELTSKKRISTDGYHSLPIKWGRWVKKTGDVYGTSPSVVALPAVIQLNAIMEMLMEAAEKKLKPPLGLLAEVAVLKNGVLDLSPGALNIMNPAIRALDKSPIQPLYSVEELQSASNVLEFLVRQITQAFYLDRLLDLNNTTRMTLGEAQIRAKLRGESLGGVHSRVDSEILTPLIERSFDLLYDMGYMGYLQGDIVGQQKAISTGYPPIIIPEELRPFIMNGVDIYDIEYLSPARQIEKAGELQGVATLLEYLERVAQIRPDAIDVIDLDDTMKSAAILSGAPLTNVASTERVQKTREQRAAAQEEARKLEALKVTSEANRTNAQAQSTQVKGFTE